MKFLFVIVALLSFSAFATEVNFECTTPEGVVYPTKVTDNHVEMNGLVFTNMMDVSSELYWRGYTLIGNPWQEFMMPAKFLNGEEGYASVEITDLDTYEHQTISLNCKVK